MTKEEKYMREAGAFECEQRTPHHYTTVGGHTEAVVKYCIDHGASEDLIKAAWLHDAGKMEAKRSNGQRDSFKGHPEVSARIAESLGESEYVVKLIRNHDAPLNYNDAWVRELAENGQKWCDDLVVLLMADLSGQHPTYQMGEKLVQRGRFIQSLYRALEQYDKDRQQV